jgi:hypothetical protein
MNSPQLSAVRFGATWRDVGKILERGRPKAEAASSSDPLANNVFVSAPVLQPTGAALQ